MPMFWKEKEDLEKEKQHESENENHKSIDKENVVLTFITHALHIGESQTKRMDYDLEHNQSKRGWRVSDVIVAAVITTIATLGAALIAGGGTTLWNYYESERQRVQRRYKELDNYINAMTHIIIDHDLPGVFKDSSENQIEEQESTTNNTSDDQKLKQRQYVANIAKAKTLTTLLLLDLDEKKRNIVLDFLRTQELCCNTFTFSDLDFREHNLSDFKDHKLNDKCSIKGKCNITEVNNVQLQEFQVDAYTNDDPISILQDKVNLLEGIRLTGSDLQRSDLSSFTLNKINLIEANLKNAQLEEAQLQTAKLTDAILSEANLNGADLTGAWLFNADLSNSSLRGATLRKASLQQANLKGADLSPASEGEEKVKKTDLRNAKLQGANLQDANLNQAILTDAKLGLPDTPQEEQEKLRAKGIEFRDKTDLRNANLTSAELRGADLTEADLRGANLSGAKGAKVFNATLCNTTMPNGKTVEDRDCPWRKLFR